MLILLIVVIYLIWFTGILVLSISNEIVSHIFLAGVYALSIPTALILVRGSGILESITYIVASIIIVLFISQLVISISLN